MQISQEKIQRIQHYLQESQNLLITAHHNPDGDAVGAALAFYHLLVPSGKNVTVYLPNDYAANLKWLPGTEKIHFFEDHQADGTAAVAAADFILHLDYNHLGRSGPMENALSASSAVKVMIDHHQQPQDFAQLSLSEPGLSSTCEMVYHLALALGWEERIDQSVAECLYTGICTDTGNFRYSSTAPATHRAAAHLLRCGVQPQIVASRIFDSNSLSRFKLLGRMLERMEVLPEYGVAILALSQKDLNKCGYQKGDTEGFVNYGLSLLGVELSVFMMPRDGAIKLSFRSKSHFDVNAFARAHFDGGGHRNAAGGNSELDVSATTAKLKKILPHYADELRALAQI